jgi:hypothetical protein
MPLKPEWQWSGMLKGCLVRVTIEQELASEALSNGGRAVVGCEAAVVLNVDHKRSPSTVWLFGIIHPYVGLVQC